VEQKRNEHKQIEPLNRDIDEHEMHLKHKKKQQTEMHNFFFKQQKEKHKK
jgi:hypothetical protein